MTEIAIKSDWKVNVFHRDDASRTRLKNRGNCGRDTQKVPPGRHIIGSRVWILERVTWVLEYWKWVRGFPGYWKGDTWWAEHVLDSPPQSLAVPSPGICIMAFLQQPAKDYSCHLCDGGKILQ